MKNIKALFIDIDNTLLRPRKGVNYECGAVMFDALKRAALRDGGFSGQEIDRKIARIRNEIRWWQWTDFMVELDLNPKRFWDFAYERESQLLEVCGAEIKPCLEKLKQAGYRLYITSNNPESGILHKLRIAGMATNQGAPLFDLLFGVSELHAMKWDREYWRKVLAQIALDGNEVATVGDDLNDDAAVPISAGIGRAFIVDRDHKPGIAAADKRISVVPDFLKINRLLDLSKRNADNA